MRLWRSTYNYPKEANQNFSTKNEASLMFQEPRHRHRHRRRHRHWHRRRVVAAFISLKEKWKSQPSDAAVYDSHKICNFLAAIFSFSVPHLNWFSVNGLKLWSEFCPLLWLRIWTMYPWTTCCRTAQIFAIDSCRCVPLFCFVFSTIRFVMTIDWSLSAKWVLLTNRLKGL